MDGEGPSDTGLYGTDNCNYYREACATNGGVYECTALYVCLVFPQQRDNLYPDGVGNWSNCMRQCLQEHHLGRQPDPRACDAANNISPESNVSDHFDCATACMVNPENPYDPNSSLPDQNISLLYGPSP
jgi:hypothetical protein